MEAKPGYNAAAQYPGSMGQYPGSTSTAMTLDGHIPEAQVVGVVDEQHVQVPVPGYGAAGPGAVQPVGGNPQVDMSMFGFMAGRRRIVIKQKVQKVEALAALVGCGCVEFENQYMIFDYDTGEEFLHVKEESEWLQRCCCKPHHEATLLYKDVRYGAAPDTLAMRTHKPFKLCCCACADICRDEAKAHSADGQLFSHAKLPMWGGGLSPKIEVMDREGGEVTANVTGPACCLGGLVELCKDIEFEVHRGPGENRVGRIIKKKAEGMTGALGEALSDSSDMFLLELPPDVTPKEAASIVNSALLIDYMFFEDGPPLSYNPADNSCTIVCCNCYCLGCVCPCTCTLGGNNNSE